MSKRSKFQYYHDLAASRRTVLKAGAGAALAATAMPMAFRLASSQDSAVTIRYWNWWDVGRTALMDEIIAGFQTEFPNITVENVPQTWDRRDEVVTTALAGGDPPEVLMATRQEIVRFADSGAIVPINSYVESEGIDLEAFYPSEIASMWWNDQLYALPMPTAGGETGFYFYNTRLVEEAGLDPAAPPQTWDELQAAATALTVLSSDGAIEQMGVNLGVNQSAFLAQLYCNNGTMYSEDLKTVTFNSAEGVETLQWLLDFVKTTYGSQQAVLDWDAAIQSGEDRFHQERLAIQFQNVSQFFHLKDKAPDVQYDVSARPYNSNNPDAASHGVAAMTFGWGYIIPVGLDPEVEAAAFKFVKRITCDEAGACFFMLEQERPSPLIACNENPAYAELNPNWDKVLEFLANDISIGVVPVQSEIFSTLTDYIDLVGFEEMSPEEGLQMAAEEAQGILDDFWGIGLVSSGTLPSENRIGEGVYAPSTTRVPITWRMRRYLGYVFIAPWLVAFLAFDLFPTASAFYYSFTDWNVIARQSNWIGVENYREMFYDDRLFWKSVNNTLYYVALSVPLGVVAGFVLALLLNTRVRFQGLFRTMFYLPAVVPTVAATMVWLWIFDTNNGILNWAIGLMGVDPIRWLTSPDHSKNALIIMSLWSIGGGMVIYLAGLQNIPQDLYEAADVDGASGWSKLVNITIPLMTPTIFFNLLLGLIGSFQVFNAAFIMTGGGPVNSTRFYMLHLYEKAFQDSQMGYACAMAVLLFLVVLAITIFVNWTSKRWVFYG